MRFQKFLLISHSCCTNCIIIFYLLVNVMNFRHNRIDIERSKKALTDDVNIHDEEEVILSIMIHFILIPFPLNLNFNL